MTRSADLPARSSATSLHNPEKIEAIRDAAGLNFAVFVQFGSYILNS